MEADFTNAARSACSALEAVDVVCRLASRLEVFAVPAFVNLCIYGPQVSESCSIVRTLELETDEWCLVSEAIDEELSFIQNTHMVSLVLHLEVAVRGSGIFEIDRVLTVD